MINPAIWLDLHTVKYPVRVSDLLFCLFESQGLWWLLFVRVYLDESVMNEQVKVKISLHFAIIPFNFIIIIIIYFA
jgi:hypothetical protein